MEVEVFARIKCDNSEFNDFLYMMFNDGVNKPLFEDEVEDSKRNWFNALDMLTTPDHCKLLNNDAIFARWQHGNDWDEELSELLVGLKDFVVSDVYTIVSGDDGWYELYVLENGKILNYESWNGKSLNYYCDGKSNILNVIENIRNEYS